VHVYAGMDVFLLTAICLAFDQLDQDTGLDVLFDS
jgi:hypothetical protein